jgi:hypothetical protein
MGIEETGIEAVKNVWDPKSKCIIRQTCLGCLCIKYQEKAEMTGNAHEKKDFLFPSEKTFDSFNEPRKKYEKSIFTFSLSPLLFPQYTAFRVD